MSMKPENNFHPSTLQAILDNTVDGIITIDTMGIIKSFNKACEKIFLYTAKEVIGHNVKKLMPDPYHSEHDQYLHNYNTTHNKKIIGTGREVMGRKKNGKTFPIDLAVSHIQVDGETLFCGITRDITEKREFLDHQEELIEKLSSSNEDLERFAYICSHDLQEPIRMVLSFSERLEKYLEKSEIIDEKIQNYLNYITDGAARSQKLVSDILEYSRLDFENKVEEITTDDLIRFSMKNLEATIVKKNAKINFENLPSIYGNKALLLQLFQNLISNAMKYCETSPLIKISATKNKNKQVISIQDNGIGINPEHQDKIFMIFQRLHNRNEYDGTGIGLAICQKIVKKHKGEIWVDSELGKGSTFHISLPC